MFICVTSGWVELAAVPDTSAATVVRVLHDCIRCRFGTPRSLVLQSDNAASFTAALTKEYCKTYGIKQKFIAPYNPQANSRVESWADVIHKSLRVMCKDQADCSKHLQSVALAYRALATTSSKLSPHEVIFGKLMELPDEILSGKPETAISSTEAYS